MRDEIDARGFGSAMVALAVDFVFGSVWTRPGLDRKQRSLVTLGILIALRRTEEFKNHVRIGLRNGLTVGEIEEALMRATAYAGLRPMTPSPGSVFSWRCWPTPSRGF